MGESYVLSGLFRILLRQEHHLADKQLAATMKNICRGIASRVSRVQDKISYCGFFQDKTCWHLHMTILWMKISIRWYLRPGGASRTEGLGLGVFMFSQARLTQSNRKSGFCFVLSFSGGRREKSHARHRAFAHPRARVCFPTMPLDRNTPEPPH